MKDFETIKKSILNEAFQSINEDIQDYMRRKAVLESFGYEYDMDKLPKLDKQWAKDIKKAVDKFADEVHVEEKNRLRFFDIVEFNKRDQYVVARFFGGLNGGGRDEKWLDYMDAITELFNKISKDYRHYWLVQLVNDCADDVFTLDIGIDKPKED
jgi:hypothetical protein